MVAIDVGEFTKVRGNPASFSSGIRWFAIDGKQVQIHAPSWESVVSLIRRNYPVAQSIVLLVK